MDRVDVAIVGLGTAGAAAAALCAERGLSVVGYERGSLEAAGAQWLNGVTAWCFDDAGIPRPTGSESHGDGGWPFHIVAGWGPTRVTVLDRDVLEVDMRFLGRRLQAMATQAGAALREHCAVTGWDGDVLQTARGPIRPRYVVDASGMKGAGLVPVPRVDRADICVAAQEVRALADRDAALAWCAEQGVAEGDAICFTGVAGGYSIVNIRVLGDAVSILTGVMSGGGRPSGQRLLDDFAREHPWVGPTRYGGARAIPVGPPRRQLAFGKLALLGDAAGQVYAAHGSGIGIQMVAARVLADCLASDRGTASYQRRFWRRYAPSLVASARFARLSRTLSASDIERLMKSGLMSPNLVRPTMEQRAPRLHRGDLRRLVMGMARAPDLALRLGRGLTRG